MPTPVRRAPLPPAHQIAGRALRVALQRRCPSCGAGDIWSGWLTLRPTCPACGAVPGRGEHDMFIGALFVNFAVAEVVVVVAFIAVMIATWPDTPWTGLMWGSAALAVIAPIVTYPYTLTFWLAVDMAFRPNEKERWNVKA